MSARCSQPVSPAMATRRIVAVGFVTLLTLTLVTTVEPADLAPATARTDAVEAAFPLTAVRDGGESETEAVRRLEHLSATLDAIATQVFSAIDDIRVRVTG